MATTKRRRRVTGDPENVELANLPDPGDPSSGLLIAPEVAVTRTPTEERRERELEDILAEVGTDARIRVYQVVNGQTSFAGEISAEGFSLESLLENFGGGEKSLTIMQGKSVREKTKVWLDPSVPAKNPRAPKASAQANGGIPGIGDMTALIGAMATQSMGMVNMMNGMMNANQQSTAAIVTAMTGMLAAGRNDPMPMVLEVAKLLRGNGGGDVSETLKLFREGLTLGKEISGGDGDDDGTMGIVREGMSLLGTIVQGIVADKNQRRLAGPGVGVPVADIPAPTDTASTAAPTTPTPAGNVRPWVQAAAPHIGKLLGAASFITPRAAADTLAERLTQEQFDDLMTDVYDADGGGFGVRLSGYFPELRPQFAQPEIAEFLGKVLQVLIDEYVEDGDDEGAGDVGSNGASDK